MFREILKPPGYREILKHIHMCVYMSRIRKKKDYLSVNELTNVLSRTIPNMFVYTYKVYIYVYTHRYPNKSNGNIKINCESDLHRNNFKRRFIDLLRTKKKMFIICRE